jgi:hypothetical protein
LRVFLRYLLRAGFELQSSWVAKITGVSHWHPAEFLISAESHEDLYSPTDTKIVSEKTYLQRSLVATS